MEKVSLQVLDSSLIEIVCSIFTMQNKHSMDVSDLMPVVITSYGQIDRGIFGSCFRICFPVSSFV